MTGEVLDSGIWVPDPEMPTMYLADNNIAIDTQSSTISVEGRVLDGVSRTAYTLMCVLADKVDQTVAYKDISNKIWAHEGMINNIPVHVYTIRQALGEKYGHKQNGAIRTAYGIGYYAVSSLCGELIFPDEDESKAEKIADEEIAIYPEFHKVKVGGIYRRDITSKEVEVLALLAKKPDRVVPHESVCMEIWGNYDETHLARLRVLVGRIRKKLGGELGDSTMGAIRLLRGLGYYSVSSLSKKPKTYLSELRSLY